MISTTSAGCSVKSLSGTIPVPVSRNAPLGNELSRPSQPINSSKRSGHLSRVRRALENAAAGAPHRQANAELERQRPVVRA